MSATQPDVAPRNTARPKTGRPNILFLMCDQLQAQVFNPGHPCKTPNLDRLAQSGVRFVRAYTPNAVCSPARASLMTGLLPHNHGVLEVVHNVDDDQSCLRTDKPHWAQRLRDAGYKTGYFGKWHVERSEDLQRFGWSVDGGNRGALFKQYAAKAGGHLHAKPDVKVRYVQLPRGYREVVLYGVTEAPAAERGMGIATNMALDFLESVVGGSDPWCCFVSLTEPHDPFVCGREAYERYDPATLLLSPNAEDRMLDKPALYRKCARNWSDLSTDEKKEALACYYALVTEIDEQFGRILDFLDAKGVREETIVVLTADHGELLGAHGLYCKNISAFEEIYNIPLIVAGPGVAQGKESVARVGLHDLCPTLIELAGAEPIPDLDARSFASLLQAPDEASGWTFGFAEYHGGRYRLTQRIVWDGPWKLVHNGFDEDELYNLKEDPWEVRNLACDPAYASQLEALTKEMWRVIKESGDHSLYNSHYPPLRLAPVGPGILEAN